jgi:Tetracyclin repressor-like, C-terminal domain
VVHRATAGNPLFVDGVVRVLIVATKNSECCKKPRVFGAFGIFSSHRLQNIEAFQQESYALVRAYLEAHRDEIDVADLDLAAIVLVTVVEALTHAAVLRRPDILSDEKAGRFVDDVTRLVVRYLRTS